MALAGYVPVRDLPRQGDEGHHFRQVQRFCAGDASLEPRLTTFPGFHAVLAAVAAPLGRCDDVPFLRLVNVLIGAAGTVLFFVARRQASGGDDLARTAQLALLPALAPYHPQLYTDTLATVVVLLSLVLAARNEAAGTAVGGLGLLVRQTNAPWLGFLLLRELDRTRGPWRARLAAWLRATWPGVLAAAAFGVFVLAHGGVALKERKAHPVGLHLGNAWLFLALAGLLLLPHAVAAVARRPRRSLLVGLPAAVLFAATFSVDHPYNRFEGFLRNDLLVRVESDVAARVVAAALVALGAALAASWAARTEAVPRTLWIAVAVALLTPWLLEHRYAIVPLVLLLLYAPRDRDAVEWSAAAWAGAITGLLVAGRAAGRFLL